MSDKQADRQNIKFIKDVLDNSANFKYLLFDEYDYRLYSFYDLIWIEPSLMAKYQQSEYVVKFILIMDNLVRSPDKHIENIMKNFFKSYGWNPQNVDVDKIKTSYINFRTFLSRIVNTIYVS